MRRKRGERAENTSLREQRLRTQAYIGISKYCPIFDNLLPGDRSTFVAFSSSMVIRSFSALSRLFSRSRNSSFKSESLFSLLLSSEVLPSDLSARTDGLVEEYASPPDRKSTANITSKVPIVITHQSGAGDRRRRSVDRRSGLTTAESSCCRRGGSSGTRTATVVMMRSECAKVIRSNNYSIHHAKR